MPRFRSKIIGLREVERNLSRIAGRASDAFGDGVEEHMGAVLAASQIIVPRDTGELAASGKVETKRSRRETVAVASYGGKGTEHAVRQHEDLMLQHRDGQQARYLAEPFFSLLLGLTKRLASRVRSSL
jgi:hypothetical protein